jgi:hypothetical protein
MSLRRTHLALVLALATAGLTVAALAGCAPAVATPRQHKTATVPTSTPKKGDPGPHVQDEPGVRYEFSCGDLLPSPTAATIMTHPVTLKDAAADDRADLYYQIPGGYYLRDDGALTCLWTDGGAVTSRDQITITMLPTSQAAWQKFVDSAPDGATTAGATYCNPSVSADSQSTCQYDAYVNGGWLEIQLNGLSVAPPATDNTLSAPVQTLVNSIVAKFSLAINTPRVAGPTPYGAIPLSNDGTKILTGAQVATAIGVPSAITMDCTGSPDGPWSPGNQAETERNASLGCFFAYGTDGGGYGYLEWMAGGEWAAKQAEAATPGESQLTIAGMPAGDSLHVWTSSNGDNAADLIIGGNWVSYELFSKDSLADLTAETVPRSTSIASIATSIEETVRG